ncbi:uncharacterized protein LOC124373240 [Homalodisca vitripennis]|uniref:uncharacterized protein LOC124361149 n=2 Tax=Homalodisca vitripennis TaxID=197043 RepID=UPI001EEC8DCB|nr:uncharacterized protein LOC124361149 [Homalodisca vitripennis]XP_046677301.1 uncharacterized protein LOC124365370 [Homalodisca vitripennis]XP_046686223.1 uncharacterized protein LOC124371899 [Homalodisca vitripennis]XP_046687583.1 uncharacterized protein LOC124373240 [Homalodisca vitripennis]
MSTCSTCSKSITRTQLKIQCNDCSKPFHAVCEKLSKVDVEFFTGDGGAVWRCAPCAKERRTSLRLESSLTQGSLTLEDVMKAIQDLKAQQVQSCKDFNNSYEALNSKVDDSLKVNTDLSEKLSKFITTIERLESENVQLKVKLHALESRLEEQEQYTRRNCIEIQGVPVRNNNVMDTVKDVGKALGMEIKEEMIDACHTLGKRKDAEGPPGIIVKFVRRTDADNLLAKRRAKAQFSTRHLNLGTDNPVYLNESLTPARRMLLKKARDFRRTNGYKWLWVRGGKILMRKEDNGPVINVKCQSDLDSL